MKRYVVGISGASGIVLAVTLVSELARLGHHIDVIISPSAQKTLYYELDTKSFYLRSLKISITRLFFTIYPL